MAIVVWLDRLHEREEVLGMEDGGAVPHGDSALVQASGFGISYETVLVVIDRDPMGDVPKRIFHLDAFNRVGVTERHVAEQRQHPLLEKVWLKAARQEDRRQEPATGDDRLELIREGGRRRFFRHGDPRPASPPCE